MSRVAILKASLDANQAKLADLQSITPKTKLVDELIDGVKEQIAEAKKQIKTYQLAKSKKRTIDNKEWEFDDNIDPDDLTALMAQPLSAQVKSTIESVVSNRLALQKKEKAEIEENRRLRQERIAAENQQKKENEKFDYIIAKFNSSEDKETFKSGLPRRWAQKLDEWIVTQEQKAAEEQRLRDEKALALDMELLDELQKEP